MNSFQTYPPYQRALLRGFLDIANGPMASTNVGPVLDAKYAAFAANGLPAAYGVLEPGAAGLKDWLATMRVSLLTAVTNAGMANVPFAVSGATNLVTAQNYVTLTGTAPLEVRTITVNGEQFFVTWSTLKNWSVRVSLFGYTNTLVTTGNQFLRPACRRRLGRHHGHRHQRPEGLYLYPLRPTGAGLYAELQFPAQPWRDNGQF
jgi:hypothetical protein